MRDALLPTAPSTPANVLFVDHARAILGELLQPQARPPHWNVTVACPRESHLHAALQDSGTRLSDYSLPGEADGYRVVGNRWSLGRMLAARLSLRRATHAIRSILQSIRPSAVVTLTNKDHLAAGPAAAALGIPWFAWINDVLSPDFFPWLARWTLARSLRRHVDRAVAVSHFAKSALLRAGLRETQVTVIHNGVPSELFARDVEPVRRSSWGVPDGVQLFGVAGRWTPWKGQALAVDILKRLESSPGPPWHLALIGGVFNEESEFQRAVLNRANELGLAGRIHLVPFVKNIGPAMRALDVLAHTSLKPEPFGRVIVEAMACGVPVVAARAGGVPEIIQDGVSGLLAAPGNAEDYACALRRLGGETGLAASLGAAAKSAVRERFSVERVASDWSALISTRTRSGRGCT